MPTGPAKDDVQTASRTVSLAVGAMPSETRDTFLQKLRPLLAREAGGITSADGTGKNDSLYRARVALELRLTQYLPPAEIVADPEAVRFPGRVGPGAQVVEKAIRIDPKLPGWRSTGLFADAGARIAVTLPPDFTGKGYALRIGCHTDSLLRLAEWKRKPEITGSVLIHGGRTEFATPFGGLIYVEVPEKSAGAAPFEAKISGGVAAPYFVLGQTSDAAWREMAQLGAPWAELECAGVILSVPIDTARQIGNPTELMQYWQRVVAAEDNLSNVATQRRRPERIVPDVQISAGFMHSGYPIMIHLPEAAEMTTVGGGKLPGWGFYHELGHNHQRPEWTFEGTGEVTCNIFSLYITEVLQGKKRGDNHSALTPEAQARRRAKFEAAGKPFAQWKADPFLALDIYMQLIDAFGWETMEKVLRSYQGTEAGPLPRSDDEKRDQWMVRYSEAAGSNLAPLFEDWGIPVSDSAKTRIKQFPRWGLEK